MYTHEKKIQTKYIGCGSNNFVTVSSGPPSGYSKILRKLHPDFNDVKIWGWDMYILELIKHGSYFKHCSVSKFTFKYHCSDYLDQTYRLSKFLWKTPGLSEDQACAWDPHILRGRGWHYTTKSQWQAASAEWDVHRPFRRLCSQVRRVTFKCTKASAFTHCLGTNVCTHSSQEVRLCKRLLFGSVMMKLNVCFHLGRFSGR